MSVVVLVVRVELGVHRCRDTLWNSSVSQVQKSDFVFGLFLQHDLNVAVLAWLVNDDILDFLGSVEALNFHLFV